MMNIHPLWKTYWGILIAGVVLCFLLVSAGNYGRKDILTERTYNAQLVNAYEYGDRCGYKGHSLCSAFRGQFIEDSTGKIFEMDINGFFYHNFVDKGRKNMPAYLQLSQKDFGVEVPLWATTLLFTGFIVGIVTLAFLIFGAMFTSDAVDEYNKKRLYDEWKTAPEARKREIEKVWPLISYYPIRFP